MGIIMEACSVRTSELRVAKQSIGASQYSFDLTLIGG